MKILRNPELIDQLSKVEKILLIENNEFNYNFIYAYFPTFLERGVENYPVLFHEQITQNFSIRKWEDVQLTEFVNFIIFCDYDFEPLFANFPLPDKKYVPADYALIGNLGQLISNKKRYDKYVHRFWTGNEEYFIRNKFYQYKPNSQEYLNIDMKIIDMTNNLKRLLTEGRVK
jgi:hypothetical protein